MKTTSNIDNRVSGGTVKNLTVQHEQSTINQCVRWLHKRGETEIDGFEFRKLPRVDRGNEAVRRATLTGEEYEKLCTAMQVYCIGKNGGLDTAERLQRQLVQHYVLVAATSGLRVGEQLQLRWSDVEIETHRDKQAKPIQLARIHVYVRKPARYDAAESSSVAVLNILQRGGRQWGIRMSQHSSSASMANQPSPSERYCITSNGWLSQLGLGIWQPETSYPTVSGTT